MGLLTRTPATDGATTITAHLLFDQFEAGTPMRLVAFPGNPSDTTVRPHRGTWPLIIGVVLDGDHVLVIAEDKPGWSYTVTRQQAVQVLPA